MIVLQLIQGIDIGTQGNRTAGALFTNHHSEPFKGIVINLAIRTGNPYFYRLPFVFSSTQNEYLTPSLKILGSVKAVASPNWTM